MKSRNMNIVSGIVCAVCIASCLLILVCHVLVVNYAQGRLYSRVEDIPPTEAGLLLGTTPQTRIGRKPNEFFSSRIAAAEQLYKAGKIKYILVSGDAHSLDGVDETQCMRDSLVARGIPSERIHLDGKGYRTLDSVVRARKVYGITRFTVISQLFHNERALYLAGHLNLDMQYLQAYNAVSPTSDMAFLTYIREYLARVKMFLDILTDKQPRELD